MCMCAYMKFLPLLNCLSLIDKQYMKNRLRNYKTSLTFGEFKNLHGIKEIIKGNSCSHFT